MAEGLTERAWLRETFGLYVSHEVADALRKERTARPLQRVTCPGGHMTLTVLSPPAAPQPPRGTIRAPGWLLLAALALAPLSAGAHGEDVPGPHGGAIRMPGAFHTELLGEADATLRVYLLDVQFRDPVVERSSVRLEHVPPGGPVVEASCAAAKDHFACTFAKGRDLTRGELRVTASRQGVGGAPVTYALPLRPAATPAPAEPVGHGAKPAPATPHPEAPAHGGHDGHHGGH